MEILRSGWGSGCYFFSKRLEQVAQTPVLGNIVNWVPYGF